MIMKRITFEMQKVKWKCTKWQKIRWNVQMKWSETSIMMFNIWMFNIMIDIYYAFSCRGQSESKKHILLAEDSLW